MPDRHQTHWLDALIPVIKQFGVATTSSQNIDLRDAGDKTSGCACQLAASPTTTMIQARHISSLGIQRRAPTPHQGGLLKRTPGSRTRETPDEVQQRRPGIRARHPATT